MNRSRAESWSTVQSLAFLAAMFAIVLGSLLPFGAIASAQAGHPLVLCSAQGPMEIQVGGDMDGPGGKTHLPKCAACVMPLATALPAPDAPAPCLKPAPARTVAHAPVEAGAPPPSRAPPRPPSTAPPLA